MDRQLVDSASLKSFGYDEDSKTLEVEFTNGGIYTYADVPPTVVQGLRGNPSVGKFFHAAVKQGGFKATKIG